MIRLLEGTVSGVLVGLSRDSLVTTRQPEAKVTLEGVEGDQHAGLTRLSDSRTPWYPRNTVIKNTRQISIVADEELEQVAAAMKVKRVLPEWLGANLALRGIPSMSFLPPSTRLFFPEDTVLVVDLENEPCIGPGKIIQEQYPDLFNLATAFPRAALHRRGLVGWVERPGVIREGDVVRVQIPQQVIYSF